MRSSCSSPRTTSWRTTGSGGFAALWFAPSGDSRFVLLGSEGGAPRRLADDPVDLLRLIAIGYDELTSWVWDEPVSVDEDDEDTAAAHAPCWAWGGDVDETIDWMEPDRVRAVANCRGRLQFTSAEGQGHAIDLDPLPAGQTGQIIHLPVDGSTPLPEYSSYRVWLSDLARQLEAGAFTVDDGGVIQLND